IAFGINALVEHYHKTIPWWLDFPGPFGIYGLLLLAMDKWSWKWGWLRFILFIRVPNLNGTWAAEIKSSYDNFVATHEATITIQQSWTSMIVRLKSETSDSYSLVASLLVNSAPGQILSYQYRNEPKDDAKKTMHPHIGTAWLRLDLENR